MSVPGWYVLIKPSLIYFFLKTSTFVTGKGGHFSSTLDLTQMDNERRTVLVPKSMK